MIALLHRKARVVQLFFRVLADGPNLLEGLNVLQHGVEGVGDAHSNRGPIPLATLLPHKVHETGVQLL